MTQCERLLAYLQDGRAITPLDAWSELGIYRLAARIHDLRRQGYDIDDDTITVANRYGETCRVSRYYMAKRRQLMLDLG